MTGRGIDYTVYTSDEQSVVVSELLRTTAAGWEPRRTGPNDVQWMCRLRPQALDMGLLMGGVVGVVLFVTTLVAGFLVLAIALLVIEGLLAVSLPPVKVVGAVRPENGCVRVRVLGPADEALASQIEGMLGSFDVADRFAFLDDPKNTVLVRTYRASSSTRASRAFADEAPLIGSHGFEPVTQTWAAGQWSGAAYIAAVLAAIFLVGLLALFYMVIVKPAGTLTVTYRRSASAAAEPWDSQSGPREGMKTCPMCAEDVKAAALICRFCHHEFR